MSYEEKLAAAKAYLGTNYCLHPKYQMPAHHSVAYKTSFILHTFLSQRTQPRSE